MEARNLARLDTTMPPTPQKRPSSAHSASEEIGWDQCKYKIYHVFLALTVYLQV